MVNFPPVTAEVKPLAHLLKLADEHDERNIVVAYWARMAACLLALKLVPGKKSPETAELIRALLDWLEVTKKANADNEGITSETIAQSLIEEYALRLFAYADQQDNAQIFNKNTVKTFYTAGMLMDVLDQFGNLPDDIREKRKYAKWKAAHIHNCLKAGEVPIAGPPKPFDEENLGNIVHNSTLSEEQLSSFTKYTGPINSNDIHKPIPPPTPPEDFIPFNSPKPVIPSDDSNFSHAPASSPITPQYPPQYPTNIPIVPSPAADPTPNNPVPMDSHESLPSPSSVPTPIGLTPTGYNPSPEVIQKAQKFSKFATSALNYDDTKNAMDYLQKAMNLLQCGKED